METNDNDYSIKSIVRLLKHAGGTHQWVNEFLRDIFGALVPGIFFLFSIISLIIPILMCSQNDEEEATCIPSFATKTDLLLSNVFQGWFWLILFFVFLILAYSIGNIFYRFDINKVDKKSLCKQGKKHFKDVVLPEFSNIVRFRILSKKHFDIKKEKKDGRKNIPPINDQLIEKYCNLLCQFIFKEEEKKKESCFFLRLFIRNGHNEEAFDNPIYKKYKSYIDNVKSYHNDSEKNSYMLALFNYIAYELSIKNFMNIYDINIKDKINKISDLEDKTVIESQFEELQRQLRPSSKLKQRTSKLACLFSSLENHKQLLLATNNENMYKSSNIILALGWYYVLSMITEYGCYNEKSCHFPYAYYDKYLLKRGLDKYIKYVKWNDIDKRTKNTINEYKIELQLKYPQEYKTLVKNEADIRRHCPKNCVNGNSGL